MRTLAWWGQSRGRCPVFIPSHQLCAWTNRLQVSWHCVVISHLSQPVGQRLLCKLIKVYGLLVLQGTHNKLISCPWRCFEPPAAAFPMVHYSSP